MYEDLLARTPLFRDLPQRELAWLGEACRERDYAAGQEALRQGGGGLGFAYLLVGRARVTAHQDDGIERELSILEAGAVVGEPLTLGEGPCPFTVTALEPTRMVVLPTWDFHTTLREYPEIAIHLLTTVSRLWRSMTIERAATTEQAPAALGDYWATLGDYWRAWGPDG